MVHQQIVFTNNTKNDLMITDVRAEDGEGNQGCHWGPGLPARWTHITPGESFIASVMFETFQDTQCYFQVNSMDNSTGEETQNRSWINMDVNAIDMLTPDIVNVGLNTNLTVNTTWHLQGVNFDTPDQDGAEHFGYDEHKLSPTQMASLPTTAITTTP